MLLTSTPNVSVVFAPQLSGRLGDAVHGGGIQGRILRRAQFGCVGPKDRNRTWPKDLLYQPFPRQFKGVQQRFHVQRPSGHGVLLAFRRKHGHEVVHHFDVFPLDHSSLAILVPSIQCHKGTQGGVRARTGTEVGQDDLVGTMSLLKAEHQLDAQLP